MLVDGARAAVGPPDGALWWISRVEGGRTGAMTVPLDGREALAVFIGEEEAGSFRSVKTGIAGDGWRVRESRRGELTSLLHDPCADVEVVALDPPPRAPGDGVDGRGPAGVRGHPRGAPGRRPVRTTGRPSPPERQVDGDQGGD